MNMQSDLNLVSVTASENSATTVISETIRSKSPSLREKFSEFGDSKCGEPLVAQRLVIEFTPDETLDSDFVQKKCCAFWKLISSRPELKKLMVVPKHGDMREYDWTISSTSNTSESVKTDSDRIKKEKTAVSMLEFVEDKGLIDRTFEAKIPQSHCTLGSRVYLEGGTTTASTKKTKHVCSCRGKCRTCKKESENERIPHSAPEVTDMCKIFEEWDRKHPRSIKHPSQPPSIRS